MLKIQQKNNKKYFQKSIDKCNYICYNIIKIRETNKFGGYGMRYETLKRIVMAKQKGTFSHMIWEKQLPVRKSFAGITVVKRTQGIVRTGIAYDNMGVVQAKRADGTLPQQNAGLTWGEWSLYPFFIKHNENQYLRVALDKNNHLQSEYFVNGLPATKEQAQMYCTKSAFPAKETKPDILTININNIISIR